MFFSCRIIRIFAGYRISGRIIRHCWIIRPNPTICLEMGLLIFLYQNTYKPIFTSEPNILTIMNSYLSALSISLSTYPEDKLRNGWGKQSDEKTSRILCPAAGNPDQMGEKLTELSLSRLPSESLFRGYNSNAQNLCNSWN